MTKFLNISTDTTLGGSAPSDEIVSSQKALKAYIDSHSGGAYTAGTGIDITNAVISLSDPVVGYTANEVETIWDSVTPTV